MIEGSSQFETLKIFDRAIHSHPGHHFRMRELLSFSANLPDAFIGLHPDLFEMGYPISFDRSTPFRHTLCALPGLMHCVGNFAINIELELSSSAIADANWFGVLITRQPCHLPLNQSSFAGNAVHDLILRRLSRNSSQQPVTPRFSFSVKSGIHEGQESESCIAQPAIAIIPIPLAPDFLW